MCHKITYHYDVCGCVARIGLHVCPSAIENGKAKANAKEKSKSKHQPVSISPSKSTSSKISSAPPPQKCGPVSSMPSPYRNNKYFDPGCPTFHETMQTKMLGPWACTECGGVRGSMVRRIFENLGGAGELNLVREKKEGRKEWSGGRKVREIRSRRNLGINWKVEVESEESEDSGPNRSEELSKARGETDERDSRGAWGNLRWSGEGEEREWVDVDDYDSYSSEESVDSEGVESNAWSD